MLTDFVQASGSDPVHSYNSRLLWSHASQSRNAQLWLLCKVYLQRMGNGVAHLAWNAPFATITWPEVQWMIFHSGFKARIEKHFNETLWLAPTANWMVTLPGGGSPSPDYSGPLFRPNVKCMLEIQLQPSPDSAHVTVRCYNVPGAQPRSSMAGPDDPRGARSGDVNNQDVAQNLNVCGLRQDVLSHEFGHYLGLHHVGRHAPGCRTGGEVVCYCPDARHAPEMMGGGNKIAAWNARPWQLRLGRHLGDAIAVMRPGSTNSWTPLEHTDGVTWRPVLSRPQPAAVDGTRRVLPPGGMLHPDGGVR